MLFYFILLLVMVIYTSYQLFVIISSHHLLLANLRTSFNFMHDKKEFKYILPIGGMFSLVACPHYSCEIIQWVGFSLCFQHHSSLVFSVSMFSYLVGRSHATLKWYYKNEKHFPDLQEDWKRLIPGVY